MVPSTYAEQVRILRAEDDCAEPGPWKNDRAPYLVGVMDIMADPDVRKVAIQKNARAGVSEATRNAVNFWGKHDPGPLLIANANKPKTREVIRRQLVPMLKTNPQLRDHFVSSNLTNGEILLRGMSIDMGFPASPTSLADRTKRRCISDEVDKWPIHAGSEANPLRLIDVRMDTFGDRALHVILSSPTSIHGHICSELADCPVVFFWHVPCPHCGVYQVMRWSQVRWPDCPTGMGEKSWARWIELEDAAWYECPHCAGVIKSHDRAAMNVVGVWAVEDAEITPTTIAEARDWLMLENDWDLPREYNHIMWPGLEKSPHVGFRLSGLFSPWLTLSGLVAEYLSCRDVPHDLQNFYNSRLGEPYEQASASFESDIFTPRIRAGTPPRLAPDWTACLLATVDTQKDHFWFEVMAWGPDFSSKLVDYGRLETFADVYQLALAEYPCDVPGLPRLPIRLLLIDAGGGKIVGDIDRYRTWEVYQFCQQDPARLLPIRGAGGNRPEEAPYSLRRRMYKPPGTEEPVEITYLRIDTMFYKDLVAHRVLLDLEQPGALHLHTGVDQDWCKQMASEHKVIEGQGKRQRFIWAPRTRNAKNHMWDLTVYQNTGADFLQVGQMQSIRDWLDSRKPERPDSAADRMTTPDGRPYDITER